MTNPSPQQTVTPEVTLAKIERAMAEVSALCNGKRWQMQIPANPSSDSDLVISDALGDARDLIRALTSQSPVAAEGRRDTERLEWVMREGHGVTSSSRHGWKAWTIHTGDSYGTTFREAIDAAMSQEHAPR